MTIIDKALAIIKEFEGFRANAYPDPRTGDEPWTIGYGTTWYKNGNKVKNGDKVTEEQASQELAAKVDNLLFNLRKRITVPLTDGQWAAMISFAYNLGLAGSDLQIERLNAGKVAEFKSKHMQYINKGSNVEAGLRRRRAAELKLFEEGGDVKWVNLVRHGTKDAPEYRAYIMDGETCLAMKTWKTRDELMGILRPLGNLEVRMGEYGWHREPKPAPEAPTATLISKGFRRDHFLDLELTIGDAKFAVISGQPGAQNLRRPEDPRSVPGNREPIPQGNYRIGDIEWAGGKDNYSAVWSAAIGPVWVPLSATFSDDRSAFGFHIDGNVPGSLGCVVVPNMAELKRLVSALRVYDPKILKVDWGL
jgi:GH24 family phage-related lysozyme (muramidase)